MIRNDRVVWASCMVECADADAMITGNTRRYSSSLEKITQVVELIFALKVNILLTT